MPSRLHAGPGPVAAPLVEPKPIFQGAGRSGCDPLVLPAEPPGAVVLAAGPPVGGPSHGWEPAGVPEEDAAGDETPIVMVISRCGERLRVEVQDRGREMPAGRVAEDLFGESGRGLFIVECLADAHGAYRTSTGKTVWFEFVAWPEGAAPAVP